jgi:hypothetical protein
LLGRPSSSTVLSQIDYFLVKKSRMILFLFVSGSMSVGMSVPKHDRQRLCL